MLHSSNLRPLKRIDLLLETAARIRPRDSFKLVILAGGNFAPFADDVRRLGLEDRVIVREKVNDIEDYLQAADLGLFTSETESFCLSILEAMCFACPSVATRVGGIPEVIEDNVTGLLVPFGRRRCAGARGRKFDPGPGAPGRDGPRRAAARPRTVFRRGHRAALRSALSPRRNRPETSHQRVADQPATRHACCDADERQRRKPAGVLEMKAARTHQVGRQPRQEKYQP